MDDKCLNAMRHKMKRKIVRIALFQYLASGMVLLVVWLIVIAFRSLVGAIFLGFGTLYYAYMFQKWLELHNFPIEEA